MEPVDPVYDYLITRGTVRPVSIEVYNPAADNGQTDPYAAPIKIRGAKSEDRTSMSADVVSTTTTWLITSCDDEPLQRPPLQSRLTSQGKSWVITAITASPRNGRLFTCECVLANPR